MKHPSNQVSEDTKQFLWETWFIFSLSISCAITFVMTLPESKDIVELPYLLASVVLSLLTCLYVGTKPRN